MSAQPAKMWSGRFREPLDPLFDHWQRSFGFDRQLLQEEVAASKAHSLALKAANILTSAEQSAIADALSAIALHGLAEDAKQWMDEASHCEDIHHFVEMKLVEAIDDLGLKLHTGRSRNEQIATDLRLYIRSRANTIIADIGLWALALVELAKVSGDAVMPSYTHLQRAEPVLVAHWLLAYVEMLLRDASRLEDCVARLNYSPLGSGPIAGATLALDRTIAARELAFSAPTANSMDATSDRDFVLEYLNALTLLALHASRFAEEITLFATAEFGFVDLPEAFSTGSSAMPQKKNPDLTELVRAKVGRINGAAQSVTLQLKGLPLAYNKDMQETQEPVFAATSAIDVTVQLLAKFTAALKFRTERMRAACESGFLNAMAAATYLVYKGVPFRKAHEKIGNAVRYCLDKGCELNDLTLDELKQFGTEFEQDFFAAITLEATLDCHDVIGGTARHRVREALVATETRVRTLLKAYAPSDSTTVEAVHAGA
ncbi:argininosuccinate lyase [Alloacidobacterium dinghuense]|uniref:Argininosuccinate lyase n=1 Tax=Alloacidobacterium dinghuense TaxID=2763107 RepID=A0A7G8BMV3_9BACT|nr:argininosuccinate lyase [Alloacidobacterium dinghuense]QNI33873.1 argininosuccinate lyase [Alloacidobacterium dinghuense]